jgi:Reverse transcriptase (RNA-dependent DNA polymerase)
VLNTLNSNPGLDFKICLENAPNYDPNLNVYNNINVDSLFYDVDSFISKFRCTDMPIFMGLNVQSINAKHSKLTELVDQLTQNKIPLNIIALQETWHIQYPNLLDIPGYQRIIFKNRTVGRGGGVGYYLKNGLNYKILEPPFRSFINKIFESLTLEISDNSGGNNKRYIVTNIYRSPTAVAGYTLSEQHEEFFNKFEQLMTYCNSLNVKSYIFLDANINLLESDSNQNAASYFNTICNNGYLVMNIKATRMSKNCNTLIDHVLSNEKVNLITSGSIIDDISDHWPIFLQLNEKVQNKKPKKQAKAKKRLVTVENLTRLQDSLKNLHWNDVLSTDNVNDCYATFWSTFKVLYDMHVPLVATRFNRNYHRINDFMTGGLLISRRTKIALLKQSVSDPSDENVSKYKDYRNLYNKLIKVAKKKNVNERLEKSKKNPKKTWEILNELTGRGKTNANIQKLCSGGLEYTDSKDKANVFNKFFCSVGEAISNSIEPTSANFEDFLRDNPNTIPLEFGLISQAEFITIINNLEPKSSNDIDGISNKILKFLKFEIATPLVHLFNLSLQTGDFPENLKTSRTVPIFKAGDPTLCDNYRPISLLSSISKVLEKAVACRLVNHLRYNNLINENQFGFQEGISTVHHLLKLTNYVTKELNKKNYTVGVFLDLKKAFDVVPHRILLKKLERLGIRGIALRWFTSYLNGRMQRVEIDGQLSEIEQLTISILQGSILGPILFLCFINDLPNCTELLTLMFADDTAGLSSGPELKPLIQKVNAELQKLSVWFRANKMAVNVSKTKYIIFKPKGKTITLDPNEGIKFNNNDINGPVDNNKIFELERIYDNSPTPQSRSYKLLGVLLDENLSFDQHCNMVCNKLAQSSYIINKVKNMLPRNLLRTLYFSLFNSHLLYCLPLYSCTANKNLKKITIMQKKVVRAICNAKYNDHTEPLFQQLSILPFEKLIMYTKSLLMHSIIHKYGPKSLHNQWIFNNERNVNIELRNENDIYVPMATSEQVKKLPYFAFATCWNNLILEKQYPNPLTFKIALTDHLKNN